MCALLLKSQEKSGEPCEARFDPKGLRLLSLKCGDREIHTPSDPKGYYGVIGPQFGDLGAFMQTGEAMAASWEVEKSEEENLTAKHRYEGEGEEQIYQMEGRISWDKEVLVSTLSIVSDTDSLIGPGYCFPLPDGRGRLEGVIKREGFCEGKTVTLSEHSGKPVEIDLSHSCSLAVLPYLKPTEGKLLLETKNYQMEILYRSNCEEVSCLIYRPEKGDWICISPVSSKNPWKTNLTVSHVTTEIKFLDKTVP